MRGLRARDTAGAGLAEERDGRWYLTEKGRGLAAAMHEAARAHYATLAPLPKEELAELARLLDRAFVAAAKATEPDKRIHTAFAFGYRDGEPPAGALAQLDAAGYRPWQGGGDPHHAAPGAGGGPRAPGEGAPRGGAGGAGGGGPPPGPLTPHS